MLRLLRPRRERPRGRAAEQRDELAAITHSITSSARASSVGGTARPSALAVLTLMTISIFVENSIGRSPGFAPFRILSTNAAVRRDPSRDIAQFLHSADEGSNPAPFVVHRKQRKHGNAGPFSCRTRRERPRRRAA